MIIDFAGWNYVFAAQGFSKSPIRSSLTSGNLLPLQYERFRMGRLRLGLVLEDVDSLAADIAARHLAGSNQVRVSVPGHN